MAPPGRSFFAPLAKISLPHPTAVRFLQEPTFRGFVLAKFRAEGLVAVGELAGRALGDEGDAGQFDQQVHFLEHLSMLGLQLAYLRREPRGAAVEVGEKVVRFFKLEVRLQVCGQGIQERHQTPIRLFA